MIDNSGGRAWPGGAQTRFAVEGWRTSVVDGRDRAALTAAFAPARDAHDADRPAVVIAQVEAA